MKCDNVLGQYTFHIVVPEIYNDYNTCITEGYVRSLNSLKEMGEEDVNKYMIFIKFVCQQDTRIDT